ncbi:MAG: hypothetical protein GQ533_09355 [Methanosarcinaceae archaeon]|nr:hypothetical protein [Methanosarcinaceae archaeon]
MHDDFFLDTSIAIRRIENSPNGESVRNYLSNKTLFTSTFVLMEFKRTVLLDAVSLYTILKEEQTLDDVYWRLKDTPNDTVTEKVAQRWILLLSLLDYPRNKDKRKAIARLENYIRYSLIYEFKKNVNLIESKTLCNLAYCKPYKKADRYKLDMVCQEDKCNIQNVIIENDMIFEKILKVIDSSHEPFFKDLSSIINEVFDDISNMKKEYCSTLGDVIIAIDSDNMKLCSSDHHFNLICQSMDKSVVIL